MSEEDKLKTNNEKVTIDDYYYYYLLKCEDIVKEVREYIKDHTTHYTSYLGKEPKVVPKIEKIETYDKDGNIFIDEQCFKYVPIDKQCLTANEQVFVDKINKVIDYINKEDK